jgi:hypothetical protein
LLAGKAPVSSELCCLSPEQLTTSGCQPTD